MGLLGHGPHLLHSVLHKPRHERFPVEGLRVLQDQPRLRGCEARVFDKLRPAYHLQRPWEAAPSTGDVDVAVLAGERTRRHCGSRRSAREHLVHKLGGDKLGRSAVLGAGLGLDYGDINVLALAARLACEEGGHSRRGPYQARLSQRDVAAVLDGLALRQPQTSQVAAHAVKHDLAGLVVPIRPRLPEVGDGYQNHLRVDLLQVLVGQAEGRQHPRGEIFHHNVHLLDKLHEHTLASRALQVEGHAALVGVEVQEEAALLRMRNVVREWAHAPGDVAAVGPLHLDDVGSVVGQHLGAEWTGDVPSQVQDAHIGKRHVRHQATSGCPSVYWRMGLGIVRPL